MRVMLRSKIHRARVTSTNIEYEGSITIDKRLLEEADILPYEQVQVLNVNNGVRFTTYAIEGRKDSGEICINGAAARLAAVGDIVIVISYHNVEDEDLPGYQPTIVHVNAQNRITETKHSVEGASI